MICSVRIGRSLKTFLFGIALRDETLPLERCRERLAFLPEMPLGGSAFD